MNIQYDQQKYSVSKIKSMVNKSHQHFEYKQAEKQYSGGGKVWRNMLNKLAVEKIE